MATLLELIDNYALESIEGNQTKVIYSSHGRMIMIYLAKQTLLPGYNGFKKQARIKREGVKNP